MRRSCLFQFNFLPFISKVLHQTEPVHGTFPLLWWRERAAEAGNLPRALCLTTRFKPQNQPNTPTKQPLLYICRVQTKAKKCIPCRFKSANSQHWRAQAGGSTSVQFQNHGGTPTTISMVLTPWMQDWQLPILFNILKAHSCTQLHSWKTSHSIPNPSHFLFPSCQHFPPPQFLVEQKVC